MQEMQIYVIWKIWETWNQGDMKLRRIGRDRLNFMPHFVWKQKSALISCRLNFMSPCFHVALISCFKVVQKKLKIGEKWQKFWWLVTLLSYKSLKKFLCNIAFPFSPSKRLKLIPAIFLKIMRSQNKLGGTKNWDHSI